MMRRRSFAAAVAAIFAFLAATDLHAQSVTTGAVGGIVTDENGRPVPSAQIRVTNAATGAATTGTTRENGAYLVQGLEVGSGYTVTARRIGYNPQTVENVQVALSQTRQVNFRLVPQAVQLAGVQVVATNIDIGPTVMGAKTTVSDTLIQRLPTSDRNLTDFIRLTPQASQSGPGYSAGGMSNRMNNVQIDGATERDVFGLGTTGQFGGEVNARSVSIDAVKEYQVILAPYDVRQGNFGGLLLNAVTRRGTNDFTGSAFWYFRDQGYSRNVPATRTPFERKQYGFTLGGPIIRDRLHFFVAPEFQREFSPVPGPYLGQPADAPTPLRVQPDSIARFESIMRTRYATDPGTAGAGTVPNPLRNVLARLDYQVNDVHRVVFRYNYHWGENLRRENARSGTAAVFSSNWHTFTSTKSAPTIQLFSNFPSGSYNELFLSYNRLEHRRVPPIQFPQVTVTTPLIGAGSGTIRAGADQFSQGKNELDIDVFELVNNYTRPMGNHTFTVGTRQELAKLRNQFTESVNGIWTFTSLANFENGVASSFRREIILANEGNAYFDALQSAFYIQDQWQVNPRLALNLGLRTDVSSFLNDIPYNAAIDSAYGRSVSDIPDRAVQFSPRLGFNWDIRGNQVDQLRGGVGLFVGTPPYVWLENAYINNGSVVTFLNCNTSGSTDPAPAFNPDPSGIGACANGAGFNPIGSVNFLDKNLKFPQPFRATLAYDRVLFGNVIATLEGLYSRNLNQLFFINENLTEPVGVDSRGRVMYGTIATSGVAFVAVPPRVAANGGLSRFAETIDLTNQNKDYAYNLTAQLRRRFSGNWEGMAAYTYSRARDVQSLTSSRAISNWRFGRTLAGRQDDPYLSTSLFDQPHKIVATGTYTLRWLRDVATDLSFFYQGVSGAPFDYVSGGFSGAGDLNADGSQGNDLIYVPRNALDPTEIQFRNSGSGASLVTAAQQAAAFEQFIQNSECLSEQRGQILRRNSCRLPFSNRVDVAIRQVLPAIRGQRLSMQLDIFNFGNLLGRTYGTQKISTFGTFNNLNIYTHVGQSSATATTAVPIVQFNVNQTQEFVQSGFATDYWRTQLSFRYSF